MQIKKTMNLPKELLEDAVKLSGAQTQTMAVVLALEEFIRKKRMEALIKIKNKGAISFSKNFLEQSRKR